MKAAIFIDTGAFYARYVPRDAHHAEAQQRWERVRAQHLTGLTTNLVLAELITLLNYRFGTRAGLQAAREIYASHAIQIIPSTLDLELQALTWLERFADQSFSMTDACSFAVMEHHRLRVAFSFDHHFQVAGFEAFE